MLWNSPGRSGWVLTSGEAEHVGQNVEHVLEGSGDFPNLESLFP